MLEQFFCQAHGPTGVVSDCTIDNLDREHCDSSDFGQHQSANELSESKII